MCQKSLPSWKGTWTPGKTLKPIGIWTKSICTTMAFYISRNILQSILNSFILPRVRFCLPVGEKLDGRVECFLFTPFNKKYRFKSFLHDFKHFWTLFWPDLEPCTSAVISPASPVMFLASSILFCLLRCCCLTNIASKKYLGKMLLNNACGLIACWDNVTFGARCVFLYRKWGMLGRVN